MTGRPGMSERQLDDHVRRIVADVAAKFPYRDPLGAPRPRLLAYHTHDSRHSPAGFPDWTFAGIRGVMFRENKTAKRSPSPLQREWIYTLRMAGADVAVWRPADLESGLIPYELLTLAGLHPAKPRPGALEARSVRDWLDRDDPAEDDGPDPNPDDAPAPVVRFSPAAEALIDRILERD